MQSENEASQLKQTVTALRHDYKRAVTNQGLAVREKQRLNEMFEEYERLVLTVRVLKNVIREEEDVREHAQLKVRTFRSYSQYCDCCTAKFILSWIYFNYQLLPLINIADGKTIRC
jgi:hypothetical protein